GWMSMKPPPPMLPASGQVTARAKPTATAASTALPPFFRTATPTSAAGAETQTTMPLRPVAEWAAGAGVTAARAPSRARAAGADFIPLLPEKVSWPGPYGARVDPLQGVAGGAAQGLVLVLEALQQGGHDLLVHLLGRRADLAQRLGGGG